MLGRLLTHAYLLVLSLLFNCDRAWGVSLPACQILAPQQKNLTGIKSSSLTVAQSPFGIVYAAKSNARAFVAAGQELLVLDTTRRAPRLIYALPLNSDAFFTEEGGLGIVLSHDGRYLFIAGGYGALIVDTSKALRGDANGVVVGMLQSTPDKSSAGMSANQITISQDDQYVFVSQEYGSSASSGRGVVEVFKLNRPTYASTTVTSDYIGAVALGGSVVGVALSHCGQYLYVTSEVGIGTGQVGTLSVLDVATLKIKPTSALRFSVKAGCEPVQVRTAPDGKTVWVAARASNYIIAFDAAKLASNASDALVASVQVGEEPVEVAFLRGQSRILVANGNRYNVSNATSSLSLVDFNAAVRGGSTSLGQIHSGIDPRGVSVSADGRSVLVTNFGAPNQARSSSVQKFDVSSLP